MSVTMMYEKQGSREAIKLLIDFMYDKTGVVLTKEKAPMVQSRLQKRAKLLQAESIDQYIGYALKNSAEQEHLISALTTHKTHFFREYNALEYIRRRVYPEWQKHHHQHETFKIWSAACSTGEEPYSIAIDFIANNPSGGIAVCASDICADVLKTASRAIYPKIALQDTAPELKERFFLPHPQKPLVKVVDEITKLVQFKKINLIAQQQKFGPKFDVIFCRNVLIYFDLETRRQVVHRLYSELAPGGYLVVGSSESTHNLHHYLEQVSPSIFKRIK